MAELDIYERHAGDVTILDMKGTIRMARKPLLFNGPHSRDTYKVIGRISFVSIVVYSLAQRIFY